MQLYGMLGYAPSPRFGCEVNRRQIIHSVGDDDV